MSCLEIKPVELDLFLLEDTIWIAGGKTNVPVYDFEFEKFFACRHSIYRPEKIKAVGRFGVSTNYEELFYQLQNDGIELIHLPEQYLLASDLTHWYPLILEITPKSVWFENPPEAVEIEKIFEYPVFIKGSRQTSRHKAKLSIINSPDEYRECAEQFKKNPILHWQKFVVREFVKLRKVEGQKTDKIPPSFEFRTFWWKGKLVGAGSYWKGFANYNWTKLEQTQAIGIARQAVEKLNLPFVVIDVAQKESGEWIVIECNDGQESGYAAVSPIALWQNIIDIEKNASLTDY